MATTAIAGPSQCQELGTSPASPTWKDHLPVFSQARYHSAASEVEHQELEPAFKWIVVIATGGLICPVTMSAPKHYVLNK